LESALFIAICALLGAVGNTLFFNQLRILHFKLNDEVNELKNQTTDLKRELEGMKGKE
jgi:hypothetical protein